MIEVTKHGVILRRTDLDFENEGVLNPAAFQEGDTVHIFYRALRTGNHSTIGYCRLNGPLTIEERFEVPILFPEADYESQGVEDPRITKIDGLYYLTYTAYDGVNAFGAYAVTAMLPHFEKKGIFTHKMTYESFKSLAESKGAFNERYVAFNRPLNPSNHPVDKPLFVWNKNVIFFPSRIQGKLHFLHRIKPGIQLVAVNEMEDLTPIFWEDYFSHFHEYIVLEPKYRHEISYIGGGCPPIETEHGWLLIYHGVHDTEEGHIYVACAALMDLEDPSIEIARLPYALFSPDFGYELVGEVNNVCFPTGTSLFDDTLYIYYGAADKRIACASMSFSGLLEELVRCRGTETPALSYARKLEKGVDI